MAIGLDVGSYAAICADVSIQGSEVRVDRVTATLDCGLVVNPDGAVNQIEGSIVMGMGTALYESIEFRAGRVLNAGFTRYRVPRTSDAPRDRVAARRRRRHAVDRRRRAWHRPHRTGHLERGLRADRRAPPGAPHRAPLRHPHPLT